MPTLGCGDRSIIIVAAVWLVCSVPGCGTQTNVPKLQRVEGVVTLAGQPLTSGQIRLFPDSTTGARGPSVGGVIHHDGRYELFGPRGLSGAVPGRYRVAISTGTIRSDERSEPTGMTVPFEYSRPDTSGLAIDVALSSGPLRCDFHLTQGNAQVSTGRTVHRH